MPYLGVRPADITSATEAEIAGDLTVDTSTLKVDAANNRVAIGATSSVARLEIEDGGTSDSYLMKITADDQNPYAFMVGNDTYSSTDSNGFGFVQRNDGTAYIYNGGALRAAFHSVSGGVLSVEGGVVLGAGAANSTTANTLDDYEEGTFTPTLIGSSSNPTVTYSGQQGHYTKVGNLVSFQIRIHTSAYSGGSGNLYISGLPFTASSSLDSYSGAVGLNYQFGSNLNPMAWSIDAGGSFIYLWQNNNNADVVVTGNGAASLRIRLQGFYYT